MEKSALNYQKHTGNATIAREKEIDIAFAVFFALPFKGGRPDLERL